VQYLQQRNIKTHVIPGVLPSLMHALLFTLLVACQPFVHPLIKHIVLP